MEYHQITLSEWAEWKKKLRQELNNVRTAFVRVGYVLRKIDETEAYKVEGYKSVAEFAEKEHGLKPSTTSRWMAINREFSVGGYSEQLDERYIDLNASQLTEMLGLPMEDRGLVTTETSRADLRELKKFNKESAGCQDVSPMQDAFVQFLEKNEEVAEKVSDLFKGGNAIPEQLAEIVAPSGNRMFRAGTKFITFQTQDIKVKAFGGTGVESVAWEEFKEIAEKWLENKNMAMVDADEEEGGEVSECDRERCNDGRDDGEDTGSFGSACREDQAEGTEDHGEGSRGESNEGSGIVRAGNNQVPDDDGSDGTGEGSGSGAEEIEEGVDPEIQQTEKSEEKPEDISEVQTVSVDMNPPENADPEIAPAQFAPEIEDEEDEEELTLQGKISEARKEVRICIGEITRNVDLRSWEDAREAAEELLGYLQFLCGLSGETKKGDTCF